jgi:hypothetical protein
MEGRDPLLVIDIRVPDSELIAVGVADDCDDCGANADGSTRAVA